MSLAQPPSPPPDHVYITVSRAVVADVVYAFLCGCVPPACPLGASGISLRTQISSQLLVCRLALLSLSNLISLGQTIGPFIGLFLLCSLFCPLHPDQAMLMFQHLVGRTCGFSFLLFI